MNFGNENMHKGMLMWETSSRHQDDPLLENVNDTNSIRHVKFLVHPST